MSDIRMLAASPYRLSVVPPTRAGGLYHWVILKEGKQLLRSGSTLLSEAKARASGVEAIERLLREA